MTASSPDMVACCLILLKVVFFYPIACIGVGILLVITYRLFFHPLSSIPGPRLAGVSNVWYANEAKNGRMAILGKNLHRNYGPVIRVGPDEVWFNSKSAFKTIYSAGSGYEKSDFYLGTALTKPIIDWNMEVHSVDSLDLLSERDMKRYRQQRRLIGPTYRPGNVVRHEISIDKILGKIKDKFRTLGGEDIDLKEWIHITVVECLGAAVLSWSPGMLAKETDQETSTHSYVGWRRKAVFGLFPLAAKLQIKSRRFGRAFGTLWGLTFQPPPNFRAFFPDVNRRISKRLKALLRNQSLGTDLAEDLIQLHKEKPEFTESYLRKMIVTNFGAGHETMASTLISVMAMLGSHPDVQDRLAKELRQLDEEAISWSTAANLPYLQAVIKESQRLNPVIAMSLPRKVPAPGVSIDGYFMPQGTTVGCHPFALHRNEAICGPNPENFDPDRWLQDDGRSKNMEMYSLTWGGGARTCPGRYLAEMTVYKVVASLIREFEVQATIPSEEAMPTYFLSMMTGVKARLHPREV